jgi:NAD+--asparagine ADP-ribosyltransferase
MIGKPSQDEISKKRFHENYMGTIASMTDEYLLNYWKQLDKCFREKSGNGYTGTELRATGKELKKRGLIDSQGKLNIVTGEKVK